MLIARMSDLPAHPPACRKRPIQLYPKPFAELTKIRQRSPNEGRRGRNLDLSLDPLLHNRNLRAAYGSHRSMAPANLQACDRLFRLPVQECA